MPRYFKVMTVNMVQSRDPYIIRNMPTSLVSSTSCSVLPAEGSRDAPLSNFIKLVINGRSDVFPSLELKIHLHNSSIQHKFKKQQQEQQQKV